MEGPQQSLHILLWSICVTRPKATNHGVVHWKNVYYAPLWRRSEERIW